MAELEVLHLRLAVAVQVITAVVAVATVAMAAMLMTTVEQVAVATVAMALEVMEVTAPKVGYRLPLEDLPLVAVAVSLFLEVLPEIARRLVVLASASLKITYTR